MLVYVYVIIYKTMIVLWDSGFFNVSIICVYFYKIWIILSSKIDQTT